MIHVRALPGTPHNSQDIHEIIETAVDEAREYEKAGFDALLIENMHDVPYLARKVGPEIVAAMTSVTMEVCTTVNIPVGVQILAGANKEALATALAGGADFIRAEGFVYAHVADEGFIESDAGELLRYRRQIDAEDILIMADVKKKHSSHAITSDIDLEETARTAEFFGADALVITGSRTGVPALETDLMSAASGSSLPLIVGSGTTPENMDTLWKHARGFIIGSYCKKDGIWRNEIDRERMEKIIKKAESHRSKEVS